MAEDKNKFMEVYQPYGLAQAVVENPNSPETRSGLEAVLQKDLPELGKLRSKPSDDVSVIANNAGKYYQKGLVDYVNANIDGLVSEILNKDNALALALGFKPNLDSEEAKLITEIQAGSAMLEKAREDPRIIEAMAKELLQYDIGNILKSIFAYNPEWIVGSYQGLVAEKQRNLAAKFSNEAGKLNVDAVRNYVAINLEATPDKEKEATYTGFADYVAQHYVNAEKAKQAKKEQVAKAA